MDKVATKAPSKGSATTTALQMGLMLFLLTRLGAFVFGAWWGATAVPALRAFLQGAQIPNVEVTLDRILGLALFPFNMAILVVLAPLFGWWIYSRVDKARQDVVGWLGALIFSVFDAVISLVFAGIEQHLGYVVTLIPLLIGEGIIILWVMFFMGIGFNLAKLFKAPL